MHASKTKLFTAELAKRIAEKRVAAQLTQENVAEQLGIGMEAVSRIERGLVIPNVLRLAELAGIFNCRTDELLEGTSLNLPDQAAHLASLLKPLSEADRKLVIDMLTVLVTRLGKK